MDLPHSSPKEPGSDGVSLERDFRKLHTLFMWAVGALLLFSLAANLFIGKQLRLAQFQLPAQRDGVIRQAMEFQKRDEPLIRKFVARLQDFARTHPEFQPLLDQYRSTLGGYFVSLTPGLAPQAPAKKAK